LLPGCPTEVRLEIEQVRRLDNLFLLDPFLHQAVTVTVVGKKATTTLVVLPLFQIIRCFYFSRCIAFTMYLDITYT